MYIPIIFIKSNKNLTKLLQKIKWCSFFASQCIWGRYIYTFNI